MNCGCELMVDDVSGVVYWVGMVYGWLIGCIEYCDC